MWVLIGRGQRLLQPLRYDGNKGVIKLKCPECGCELPDDSEFCQYCGAKLNKKMVSPKESYSTGINEEPMKKGFPAEENPFVRNDLAPGTKVVQINQSCEDSQADSEMMLQQKKPTDESKSENSASAQLVSPQIDPTADRKKQFCRYCGGVIDPKTKKCYSCGKQYFRFPKKAAAIMMCFLVFAALAGLNVYQYLSYQNSAEADAVIIDNLEQQAKIRNANLSSLNSQLTTLKQEITSYQTEAKMYHTICDFLKSGNAGYASSEFLASDSIIVISESTARKSFILTVAFESAVTVNVDTSGRAANVDFSESNWSGSTTTIYVTPNYVGTTVATFSNNLNSQTFQVLVVVTE